ncbi:hypothetical protein JCM8202_002240 [Rhodotorula sphaerocarpa]
MLFLSAGVFAIAFLAQLVSATQLSSQAKEVSPRGAELSTDTIAALQGVPHGRRGRSRLHTVARLSSVAGHKRDKRAAADLSSTRTPTGPTRASASGTVTKSGPRTPPTRAPDQAVATTAPSFPSADIQPSPDTVSRLVPSHSVASMAASMSLATSGGPEASPVTSTSPTATPGNTTATSSASTARPLLQVMPGRHISVFPIGLVVFGSVNGIALLVTAYMYWERRAYARQFEERRRADKKGALLPTS